jgi:hypothetical protein
VSTALASSGSTAVVAKLRAIAALPGAHTSDLTPGSLASFQLRACSRAPEPKTRIRMPEFRANDEKFGGGV